MINLFIIKRRIIKLYKCIVWFFCHINERDNILYTSNRNLKERISQMNYYDEMYKKYRKIIEKGVPESKNQQPSNIVWILWLQGLKNAPAIVKACVRSIERNFPNKEIVVLSEANLFKYVHFPDYIVWKWERGIIPYAHFSDLIRINLLCEYGGIWCDATLLCTETPPPSMTEGKMFVFKDIDLLRWDIEPTVCSSWYIEAWSQQKILLLTRRLLYLYWKTTDKLEQYYLFHIFLAMASRRYQKEWDAIPVYNNRSPHTLQFELDQQYSDERWEQILKMSPLHKLNHHITYEEQGTFYAHVLQQF